ncbi:hypothetical protein PIB30_063689 [Stylosanthes scabra]|uniref:TIR domain-containing protein n=1 Tax=Stylosanthes scabra TaxID=79078 RepID=A0ABU6WMK9_9FABA|nr:hypothetical protein [Stylosanthes scabra]
MSYYQSAERISDRSWKYDVYFSFLGQDSYGFSSDLYQDFRNAGIHAFIDDEDEGQELQSGDQMTYTVAQAIEGSRVSVVVLSQDVRHQRGPFEKIFQSHMDSFSDESESEKVLAWRAALTQAANIAGFEISTNRNEVEVIRKIVSHVRALLDSEDEFIKLDYPVGVQSRKEEVIQLLHSHTAEHVVLMGIWGMIGVGKTTIASFVYNQIRHDFDGPMFLPNIREKWKTNKVFLQEELLNGICKEIEWIKIRDIQSGITVIRERLGLKKVLVVLDDVDNINQLLALCGSREWFGAGSIIIITTTDRHLLRTIGVDYVYQVKELDYNESLELFSFKQFDRIAK